MLVGERDGGFVPALGAFERFGPAALVIGAPRGEPQFAASAVDEEGSEVGVAALGDAAELELPSGGVLFWGLSRPRQRTGARCGSLGRYRW